MRPDRAWVPYLFLAPALALFAFAVLGPTAATVGFSFVSWDGFGPMRWVGLDNYVKALRDPIFTGSFLHVTIYVLATIVLEVAAGLCFAGFLSARRGRSTWFRVALFTPVMLPMVVVSVLWRFVYNADFGLLNGFLNAIGLPGLTTVWLGNSATALLAVCVVSGWVYAGFYMAIFYAAFAQIPVEVIEGCRLDGAGEWTIFRRIKVPMIRGAVQVSLLLCITGGIQAFDLFYVLTGGGPYHSTEVPTTYMTRTVFRDGEVGYGSAMAVTLTAVVVILGLVFTQLRRRHSGEAM